VLGMFVSTYKEIKEIRTQLSMVAYLFASPKQHVDPSFPLPSPLHPVSFIDIRPQCHPHPKCFPSDNVCLTVGSWVIFYANCKLSVKIVVIGLIQQCQPNAEKGDVEGKKGNWKTAETAENQQSWEFGILW